jgi:hypothetical protein
MLALVLVLSGGCRDDYTTSTQTPARRSATLATAPSSVSLVELTAAALATAEQPRQIARLRWGHGSLALGHRTEASHPGPMSITTSAAGQLLVLDQVNRRVVRLDGEGRWLGTLPITSEASEDLVVVGSSLFVLVYERLPTPGYRLERYDLAASSAPSPGVDEGKPQPTLQLRLSRRIQLATGLFASGRSAAPNIWVEMRHERCAQVVADGRALTKPRLRLGRPPGVGSTHEQHIAAVRLGDAEVRVLEVGRDARTALRLRAKGLALRGVQALQRDVTGLLFVGLLVEHGVVEHGVRSQSVLTVVDPRSSKLRLLSTPARIADALRPLSVGSNGQVYLLGSDAQGVTLWSWSAGRTGGVR